jgi:hypothetical protein
MDRCVHKKNPIKIGEGEKRVWGEKWVCVNTYLVFRGENSVYTNFSGGKSQYILIFPERKLSIYSFSGGKMSMGEKWVCNSSLQPIGPIVPNWAPRWSYLLSATHVHTTTHCMFYREQPWVPYLLRLDLIAYIPLVPQYTSSELSNFSATSWRE